MAMEGAVTWLMLILKMSLIYVCQCKKISKDGILCQVIKVMSYIGTVKRIPDNYILPQRSLAPPDNHSQSQVLKYRGKTCVMHYGNLCTDFAKHVMVLGFRQD
jgi:hypothetical protein